MTGPFDEFRRIADDLNHLPTEFEALFRQAEIQLRKEKPQGFDVVEIGQRAWSRLPYDQWPQAFRTLFYSYWLVYREEQSEDRLRSAALDARQSWMDETAYERIQSAVSCGPDDDGYATEVDYVALHDLAAEVRLLRERLRLLRLALINIDEPPF